MTAIESISIPQACHQPWQQMESKDNGRHCTHCSKTVIDFTKMTNADIIKYLSATNNVCGRFGETQLTAINQFANSENITASGWWSWLMAIGLFGATVFSKANAQTESAATQPTEQGVVNNIPIKPFILGKVAANNTAQRRTVIGKVLDEENIPMQGATVKVYDSSLGAVTDINGNFKITLPMSVTKLDVNYIGYTSQQIKIDSNATPDYQIKLLPSSVMMNEVVIKQSFKHSQRFEIIGAISIIRQPFYKRMYYNFIKRPIRKIFM